MTASGDRRAWFGVLAAPLAWAAQLVSGFGLSQAACDPVGRGLPLHAATAVISAVAAVIALGGLAAAIGVRSATDADGPVAESRRHFLGTIGIVVSPLMLCIIAMSGVGVLTLDPCAAS